jgi:hypothetical protein
MVAALDEDPPEDHIRDSGNSSPARLRLLPRTATVRRFTIDGLHQTLYRAMREGRAIDYVF